MKIALEIPRDKRDLSLRSLISNMRPRPCHFKMSRGIAPRPEGSPPKRPALETGKFRRNTTNVMSDYLTFLLHVHIGGNNIV